MKTITKFVDLCNSMEDNIFNDHLAKALKDLEDLGFSRNLKSEQKEAVRQLVRGSDVLAVLPTGFGKSFIFQLFLKVKQRITGHPSAAVIITPLRSIISDQINEAEALGLTAASLPEAKLEDVASGRYELLFASAEDALNKDFLKILKDPGNNFHKRLSAVVVDESHTVETWTGKRKSKGRGKDEKAFREAFGKLSTLRSFCKEGTPVAALTGTADAETQSTIKKELCLRADTLCVYVSPNRVNLRFSVSKVKKDDMGDNLLWLVSLLREQKNLCPKSIIFCNTINEIAYVVNTLIYHLGADAYFPKGSGNQEHLLIGIYHSTSWKATKERVVQSFKNDGLIRVVVASTAFSMGVNFPDVRYIVNWGPARTLLDQHQEAGRAGRDGKQSHVYILYHGQQTSHCEQEVKDFVRADGCLRKAAYKTLDNSVESVQPLHNCCSICSGMCKCAGNSCGVALPVFEQDIPSEVAKSKNTRIVTDEDRIDLRDALVEMFAEVNSSQGVLLDSVTASGLSEQLVDDIVSNCAGVFTVTDITEYFPVFSMSNALRILEVVQEVFLDIPNFDEMIFFLGYEGTPEMVMDFKDTDFDNYNLSEDDELLESLSNIDFNSDFDDDES